MDKDLLEKLVQRARDLTYGMQERTGRLPDYADFRAAFDEVVRHHLVTTNDVS